MVGLFDEEAGVFRPSYRNRTTAWMQEQLLRRTPILGQPRRWGRAVIVTGVVRAPLSGPKFPFSNALAVIPAGITITSLNPAFVPAQLDQGGIDRINRRPPKMHLLKFEMGRCW